MPNIYYHHRYHQQQLETEIPEGEKELRMKELRLKELRMRELGMKDGRWRMLSKQRMQPRKQREPAQSQECVLETCMSK